MECQILIIDDDIEILDLLKIFLKFEGYKVVTSTRGIEGFELLKSQKFNLVILDLNLPDIDGERLCKIIRKESDVPILIISAKETVTNKVLCFEYGADDYLTKPFEKIELLARIKAIIRRCDNNNFEKHDNDIFIINNIVVDLKNRTCQKNGEFISLTPKEFELLIYFIKHKGIPVKRDDIIKEVWNDNSLYRWSRSLDVHVQHLRQKLEDNPKKPALIKTVSGIGYKFGV
jgi:two-component system alkaline phosphatase synthesis response regulator PhoP